MTMEQALFAAITALSGVVVYLFHKLEKMQDACEKDRDECEEDRRKLWQHIFRLEGRTGEPRGMAERPTNLPPAPPIRGGMEPA